MRFLVTGITGLIGSNVALQLQEMGEVVGLCAIRPGNLENLQNFKGKFVEGDICNFNYQSLGKFDAIFHQAAITDTTVTDQTAMTATNVTAFQTLLDYAVQTGCNHVIYASSAATYGKGQVPMKETDVPAPANIYGVSKVDMEQLAKNMHAKFPQLNLVGLRYFNVYGFGEVHKLKAASMIYQLYQQIKSGKNPRLFKYGEQFRDFVYVKDVALANIKGLDFKGNGVFNVGTGVATTFNQVVEFIDQALGTKSTIEYFDNPYGFYQDQTQADISHAQQDLKFKCQFTPQQGVADYVRMLEK